MKKSKLLLVSVLAVVLCIVCVMSSVSTTFSWFTRPRTLTGDKLQLPGQTYEIANGKDISFTTYESTDGGANYGSTPVTNFSNSALAPNTRKMYRTDVSNAGANPQSVSLFLNNLEIGEGDGKFYLGVNSPLKTYKPYGNSATGSGALVEASSNDCVKNIYVGFPSDLLKDITVSNFYLHYWIDDELEGDAPVSATSVGTGNYNPKDCGKSSHNATIGFTMYAATIPSAATGVKLKYINGNDVYDKYDGGNNNDLVNKNTVLFYRWNDGDNGYNKDHTCYGKSSTPAGISKYYSSARVKFGSKIDIAPTCTGGSVTYSSSNTNVATVSSAGVVTGEKPGSATITMTVYGKEYTDKIEKTITISVFSESSNDQSFVPVVTNVRVPGASADGASVESIFWYIKNDSDTTTLSYTISSLDLTL